MSKTAQQDLSIEKDNLLQLIQTRYDALTKIITTLDIGEEYFDEETKSLKPLKDGKLEVRDGKPYFQSHETQDLQKVAEDLFLIQCKLFVKLAEDDVDNKTTDRTEQFLDIISPDERLKIINEGPIARYGATQLFYAALRGFPKMVELLLKNGAKVNECNDDGNTALHAAVAASGVSEDKKIETVLLLLIAGAENIKNDEGRTPIGLADIDEKNLLKLLFRFGQYGNNDLAIHPRVGDLRKIKDESTSVAGDLSAIRKLSIQELSMEEPVQVRGKKLAEFVPNIQTTNPAEIMCARFESVVRIEDYLEDIAIAEESSAASTKKFQRSYSTRGSHNQLPTICFSESEICVIKDGKLHQENGGEDVPHEKALQELFDMQQNLFNKEFVRDLASVYSETKLTSSKILERISLQDDRKEIVNYSKTRKITPLHKAAHKGHIEAVEFLLRNGADIAAVDEDGMTAFHHAAGADRYVEQPKQPMKMVKEKVRSAPKARNEVAAYLAEEREEINGKVAIYQMLTRYGGIDNGSVDSFGSKATDYFNRKERADIKNSKKSSEASSAAASPASSAAASPSLSRKRSPLGNSTASPLKNIDYSRGSSA